MDAVFVYRNWQGTVREIRVRSCQDPEKACEMLEGILGTTVAVMTR